MIIKNGDDEQCIGTSVEDEAKVCIQYVHYVKHIERSFISCFPPLPTTCISTAAGTRTRGIVSFPIQIGDMLTCEPSLALPLVSAEMEGNPNRSRDQCKGRIDDEVLLSTVRLSEVFRRQTTTVSIYSCHVVACCCWCALQQVSTRYPRRYKENRGVFIHVHGTLRDMPTSTPDYTRFDGMIYCIGLSIPGYKDFFWRGNTVLLGKLIHRCRVLELSLLQEILSASLLWAWSPNPIYQACFSIICISWRA